MTLLRSILASVTEKDVKAGDGLVQQVKIYPLTNCAKQRFLDMTDVLYSGPSGRKAIGVRLAS